MHNFYQFFSIGIFLKFQLINSCTALTFRGVFSAAFVTIYGMYEGRSIYKVSCAVVFLIFRNKKFQDIRFVGNLIYNISCKFHNSDINSAKSVIFKVAQG